MRKASPETLEPRTAALLQVADYLSRPHRFIAVAEARAELRKTLELAAQGSVVLTTNGEPSAAIVPFTALEAMRAALMRLLVDEMAVSFARAQARVQNEPADEVTSDDELEALVGEAVRQARRRSRKTTTRRNRHR
jgi:antitoxin (DNA-binding transcriptional repressor) of toxin-antitoxin stability system